MKRINRAFPAFVVVSWLYVIFIMLQPVKVVAVHGNKVTSDILVKNFPLTDKGRIEWWRKNAALLEEKYHLLSNQQDGTVWINIWDFRDGYQIEKPDGTTFFPSQDTDYLLCFDEIKAAERCIKKENWLMRVSRATTGTYHYRMKDASYYQKTNGPLLLEKPDFTVK